MSASSPTCSVEVPVSRECDVSRARLRAAGVAEASGFSRGAVYRLATAVSELASNLVFHTTLGGIVRITPLQRDGRWGVEVVVEDQGPGIADLERAMTDGYSTNGGLGSGLPGSQRLMDEFEISSRLGSGTRVVARLWR